MPRDEQEVIKFGQTYSQNWIAQAQIPTSSLNGFYTGVVDPFLFQSGTLTVPYEQLDYFNELVQGTISVFQYGGF